MVFILKKISILFIFVSITIACSTISEYEQIDAEYTIHDLIEPIAALNQLLLSMDYFDSFFYTDNGDFARILYEYFIYDQNNFREFQYIKLRFHNFKRDEQGYIEKSLSRIDSQGQQIWMFTIVLNNKIQVFEVTTHSTGIPLKFQFKDRGTGDFYEKIPLTAKVFFEDLETLGEENFMEILRAGKNRLIEQRSKELFNNPIELGMEVLDTEPGRIGTIHYSDSFKDKGEVDYWINSKVPGSIVRIVYKDGLGNIVSEIELINIKNDFKNEINDDLISRQPPYDRGVPGLTSEAVSEGSVNNPVQLDQDKRHYGSVGLNNQSFYSLLIENPAQVHVVVKNVFGRIKVDYYGKDNSFQNVGTDILEIESSSFSFYTEGDSTYYFAINDQQDFYTEGEFYEIEVYRNKILQPNVISLIDRIREEAVELVPDNTYSIPITDSSLYYFKTTALKEGNIRVSIDDRNREGELLWYDGINGNYSHVIYSYENRKYILDIKGVQSGTECYYYYCLPEYEKDVKGKLKINISDY